GKRHGTTGATARCLIRRSRIRRASGLQRDNGKESGGRQQPGAGARICGSGLVHGGSHRYGLRKNASIAGLMDSRIYLDNAATAFPKPEEVYKAQDHAFRNCGNPGRGAHKFAIDSARTVFEARASISEFLGVGDPSRLVFTPGCTYSINIALRGLGLKRG